MLKAVVELAARIPPPAPLAPSGRSKLRPSRMESRHLGGGRAGARPSPRERREGPAKVLRLTSYVLPIPKL